jgi:hypothetical protein
MARNASSCCYIKLSEEKAKEDEYTKIQGPGKA